MSEEETCEEWQRVELTAMLIRVQLHMHTTSSRGSRIEYDSVISPKQAIIVLSKSGVDVAAVTDHNTTRAYNHMREIGKRKGVYVVRGIEMDTLDGHIIGLGCGEGIDRRIKGGRKRLTAPEAADLIRDFNGEVYIPHPFDIQRKGLRTKISEIEGIVEVFNPMNIFGFENELALEAATKLKRPKAVGSDAHTPTLLGSCITCIDSELNEASILSSLRKGKATFENCRYISLKEMKDWVLRRMYLSYHSIVYKTDHGWGEEDAGYMKAADSRLMRKLEKVTLELGVRRPNSHVWDFTSIIAYSTAVIIAKKQRKRVLFLL